MYLYRSSVILVCGTRLNTRHSPSVMRLVSIEIDRRYVAQVGHFPTTISDEVGKYQLTVDGYSGDAGDALRESQVPTRNSNGMKFSTPDSDNDVSPTRHCAATFGRGWWDQDCTGSCLNKKRVGGWQSGNFTRQDVQASRMLVRVN